MLSSIAESRRCSPEKPTNIVPWSVTFRTACCAGRSRRSVPDRCSRRGSRPAVLELDAVELRASDHAFLLLGGQRLPRGGVVLPLLQEQDRSAGSGPAIGDQGDLRRIDQRGFSVPSMKPVRSRSCRYGQLEVSSATDADRGAQRSPHVPCRRSRRRRSPTARAPRRVACGHHEAVDTNDVLVEPLDVRRGILRCHLPPELGPEPATRLTPPIVSRARAERDRIHEVRPRCPHARRTRVRVDDVPSAKTRPACAQSTTVPLSRRYTPALASSRTHAKIYTDRPHLASATVSRAPGPVLRMLTRPCGLHAYTIAR